MVWVAETWRGSSSLGLGSLQDKSGVEKHLALEVHVRPYLPGNGRALSGVASARDAVTAQP